MTLIGFQRRDRFAPLLIEFRYKALKCTRFNGAAQTMHKTLVITQVVNGIELGTEYFLAPIQMVQIGATKILAGVAVTAFLQWPGVGFMPNTFQGIAAWTQ